MRNWLQNMYDLSQKSFDFSPLAPSSVVNGVSNPWDLPRSQWPTPRNCPLHGHRSFYSLFPSSLGSQCFPCKIGWHLSSMPPFSLSLPVSSFLIPLLPFYFIFPLPPCWWVSSSKGSSSHSGENENSACVLNSTHVTRNPDRLLN